MITAWRKERNTDFPFYYAAKSHRTSMVGLLKEQWCGINSVTILKNTGMVVTSDTCTADDIHPLRNETRITLGNIVPKEHYKALDFEVHVLWYKNI
jgi:sialate O-acetylesterase